MAVAVVTDSTCDLPADLIDDLGIVVVPLEVVVADRPLDVRSAPDRAIFEEALAAGTVIPTTSQPTTEAVLEAWAAAAPGHEAIVSLHVAGGLSGTVDRVRAAATEAPVPVEVVDSGQVSAGLALQVIAAARAAAAGGGVRAVVEAAASVRRRTTTLLVVDDVDHLRRGGRLPASGVPGAVVRSRPLLAVRDGTIEPVGLARTWRRAFEQVARVVGEAAADAPQHVVVGHALAPDRAAALLRAVRERVAVAEHLVVELGPVVAAHTGPGAVGLAAAPHLLGDRPA